MALNLASMIDLFNSCRDQIEPFVKDSLFLTPSPAGIISQINGLNPQNPMTLTKFCLSDKTKQTYQFTMYGQHQHLQSLHRDRSFPR